MEQRTPTRTSDPAEARQLVRTEGVAILVGRGTTADDAVATAHAVFLGEIREVPPPAEVREGGVGDRRRAGVDNTVALPAHTDGFAYGERYPDHFLLACAHSSQVGGESYVVDGYRVLEALRSASPEGELVQRLIDVAVDQTEPGMQRSVTPIVGATDRGRTMLRRFPFQRPRDDSPDPAADAAMIDIWSEAIVAATADAPRFRLAPGEVALIDNYRMFHGREAYADLDRQMWRVWVWTTAAWAVPEGRLHSDSRYATAG